jgi:hypothetical protein
MLSQTNILIAPSRGYFTCLSYPVTQPLRVVPPITKISPVTLTWFRTYYSLHVRSRHAPYGSSHESDWLLTFVADRYFLVTQKPVSLSPNIYIIQYQDWVEGGITAPSARWIVASSIRSTTLLRTSLKLGSFKLRGILPQRLCVRGFGQPLETCCFCGLAAPVTYPFWNCKMWKSNFLYGILIYRVTPVSLCFYML